LTEFIALSDIALAGMEEGGDHSGAAAIACARAVPRLTRPAVRPDFAEGDLGKPSRAVGIRGADLTREHDS
jgi:hypothetical protein